MKKPNPIRIKPTTPTMTPIMILFSSLKPPLLPLPTGVCEEVCEDEDDGVGNWVDEDDERTFTDDGLVVIIVGDSLVGEEFACETSKTSNVVLETSGKGETRENELGDINRLISRVTNLRLKIYQV